MRPQRFSSRIYDGLLLHLYPSELRNQFGSEMHELFDDDLENAWRVRGAVGVASVWLCALREILMIALPGQKSNPTYVVPLLAFLFEELSFTGEFRRLAVWPGILVACVAAMVVRSAQSRVISLKLEER